MANPQSSLVPTSHPAQPPARVEGPLSPEAYQRSPTLMAGSTPGGGGAVRVWSPSRLLWIGTCISAISALASFVAMCWEPSFFFYFASVFFFSGLVYGVRALRRPCYITTDEAGIAITTPRGSRSFLWTDIERCKIQRYDISTVPLYPRATLILWAPDWVEAPLTGYSSSDIGELTSLIQLKAGMVSHPWQAGGLIRTEAVQAVLYPPHAGIGITFERELEGQLLVATIEDHSPAAEAGLMQCDHVLTINRLDTDDMDEASAASECRGPEGAPVSLKVERELWHKPLEFTVRTRSGFD